MFYIIEPNIFYNNCLIFYNEDGTLLNETTVIKKNSLGLKIKYKYDNININNFNILEKYIKTMLLENKSLNKYTINIKKTIVSKNNIFFSGPLLITMVTQTIVNVTQMLISGHFKK